MIFKRFYDEKLAHASYLVGCAKTGESIVIDANRDLDQYIETASKEGLQITAVTETHIHADYASGSKELAQRTNARLYLSDTGPAEWKYSFGNDKNVTLVVDGSEFWVGNLKFDVVATPGHTPEHITFVLTDTPASSEPLGAFTGDFLFAGDVGRPDLLEKAAGMEGTMREGAKVLFKSIQNFKSRFGDGLLIWPAHGAGSACGKALGGSPVSSLGYEKKSNWALKLTDEADFIAEILTGQPEPPYYFKEMKRINKLGPAKRSDSYSLQRLGGNLIGSILDSGAAVIDIRSHQISTAGYLRGSLLIEQSRSFTTWAGWFVDYEQPIYLVADSDASAREAARDLALIGLDNVRGWFGTDALKAYRRQHGSLKTMSQLSCSAIAEANLQPVMLDVRGSSELVAGAIPGSVHIPLGYVLRNFQTLPKDREIVVYCAAGGRSPLAVSLLENLGFSQVTNLTDGFDDFCEWSSQNPQSEALIRA